MTDDRRPDSCWTFIRLHHRTYPRLHVTLPVEYRVVDEPEMTAAGQADAAPARDGCGGTPAPSRGGGGLVIETTDHLPIGSRLALVLYLPPLPAGPAPLTEIAGEARVVWVDPVPACVPNAYRCGVEFVTLDPCARRRLVEFIRAHLVPPSGPSR